jgi:UDP-glucose 4-epimerase
VGASVTVEVAMTVLVTGGAGYIGSHMAWQLVETGEAVCVIDDLSTGHRSAVPAACAFERGDAGDGDFVRGVIRRRRVDAVVHFAGSIVVPESIRDPLAYYRNNTCVSRNLIESCVREGVDAFIFSSTAAVYGNPEVDIVDEDTPCRPVSPYGSSKLMTEQILHDTAAASPLRFVALRYFNVAGADPKGRTGQSSKDATHLIKVACQAAMGLRERVDLFGTDYPTTDGTGVRDYIHVADLVEAHMRALAHLRGGGASATLNCGYGHGYSVREVLDTVRRVAGCDFPIREAPRRAGDSARIVADSSRIRRVLGWRPRHDDLREIVSDALSWERSLVPMPPAVRTAAATATLVP